MKFSSILISTLATTAVACTFDNCNNVDEGSCGTACCKLEFLVEGETTTEVMNKLNSTIGMKGPDGLYTPMQTAEGTLTFGDLRPYDKVNGTAELKNILTFFSNYWSLIIILYLFSCCGM
jgi:hypothetical protein